MRPRHVPALVALVLLLTSHPAGAGEFDRLEADRLDALARRDDARTRARLTFGELDALPAVLKDTRAAFLIARTDQGNLVRLLITPAMRKPPKGDGAPLPVLVLERFDTFEPGRVSSRVARGEGLLLFDGFQVDLDAGVVVPVGQGGDLTFRATGEGGPRLEVLEGARLFSLARPVEAATPGQRADGRKGPRPADVEGRYRLHADGRWTGLLELRVDADGIISGQFRSEPNGTSYPVRGQVAADDPAHATFSVKFPRSEQEYDARLWSVGKWALAGTFVMLDRTHGFFAVREGVDVEHP